MFGDWEEFVAFQCSSRWRFVFALIVAGLAPLPARADLCASADETEAFRLRHLQSRLMVAALSCNQSDAYNAFVTRHKPDLSQFGPNLVAYFSRVGGGLAALNRYVTELANAAASIRSDDPQAFCAHTWSVFWDLQLDPTQLRTIAAANPIPAITQPALCTIAPPRPAPPAAKAPQKQTAAPGRGAAAQ